MSKLPGWLIELAMLLRAAVLGTAAIMLLAAGWVWYRHGVLTLSHMVTPMFVLAVIPIFAGGAAAGGGQKAQIQNRVVYRDLEQLSGDQQQKDARHRTSFFAYCFAIGLTAVAVSVVMGFALN